MVIFFKKLRTLFLKEENIGEKSDMKKVKIKTSLLYALLLSLIAGCLCGCGPKSELEIYEENMQAFYDSVNATATAINSIDASGENAATELLAKLDEMNTAFHTMAEYTVPEEFSSVETLADNAAARMNEAVLLYHQAMGESTYDSNIASQAKAKYDEAMTNIQYMGQLLMGQIPEGDGVTVTYE